MRTSQIQTVAPFSHPWHQLDCKHFWGKALPLSSASTKASPVRQASLLGARGKRFLSEVESRRLTKQCWFSKQWILLIIPVFWINSICSEFEQCSVSYLGTNENKGTYKHLPLGHCMFSLSFHFWITIIGLHCKANLIIHKTRPSSLISAASLAIWSENTTVWYHHINTPYVLNH